MKVVTFLFAFYVIRFILHKLFSLSLSLYQRQKHTKEWVIKVEFLKQKHRILFCLLILGLKRPFIPGTSRQVRIVWPELKIIKILSLVAKQGLVIAPTKAVFYVSFSL